MSEIDDKLNQKLVSATLEGAVDEARSIAAEIKMYKNLADKFRAADRERRSVAEYKSKIGA